MSVRDSLNLIGRTLGRYDILAKLGEGGMGVVYKAHDAQLNRSVALKILPPHLLADPVRRQRFTQEARTASVLNHPNIVTIYDIGQIDGVDFIAMEFVQGKTLGELIGRHGLPLKETLSIGIQAATALAKAHANGIIHRDLKPSNMMVADDGVIKIVDFGIAKLLASQDDDQRAAAETITVNSGANTVAGTILGTTAYMSPEQAEGKKIDTRSDIFSLGAVLYEMVTGARVFQRSTDRLTLAAVVSEEPTPPHELAKHLPHELERSILRCLRKDPARRFQGMADLAVELEEIRAESGTHAALPAQSTPARRVWWVIAGSLALALVAGGARALWSTSSAPAVPVSVTPLTTFHGWETWPSLSPDSRQVVFVWDGPQFDNNDLYLLPIGAANPVRLTTHPGDDVAPAWSPDGTQLAFLRSEGTEASLYLTPPTPNSERKVADVRPVSNNGLSYQSLSWLPDGRGIVLTEYNADRTMNGVVIVPVAGGERRRLTWTSTSAGTYYYPAVSAGGDVLAYAFCEGTLNCNPYTLNLAAGFTPSGTARRLAEAHLSATGLAWLPDGRSILFSGGFTSKALWQVFLDGRPRQRLSIAGDRVALPVVSRDGSAVAFASADDVMDIWKLEPEGATPFLSSTADDMDPQFSPDGKKVAFESSRLGRFSQLWVANADGSNAVPLNDGSDRVLGSVFWSPDSRWIVFDGRDEQGHTGIHVVDAAGGQPRRLTAPATTPSWSRDGKWIYFGRDGQTWKIPSQGGDIVKVIDVGGGAIESPDGQILYYQKPVTRAGRSLFAMPVGGGPEHVVLESLIAPLPGPRQWVPVDKGVYYIAIPDSRKRDVELRFFDLAHGKHETLSRFRVGGWGLSVSPDRKTILYSGPRDAVGSDLKIIRNFH
jgi:serine/threonine protein kinase